MDEEVEIELVIVEEVEIVDENEPSHIRFIIENDNDGTTFAVRAKPTARIAKVIEKMYEHLGRPQQSGDRLTRVSDGTNVFDAVTETASEYAGGTPAKKRVWDFVGAPGGAAR